MPPKISTHLGLFAGGIPGARWVPPQNYHITVNFIGEVDEGTAGDIDAGLSRLFLPPVSLSLQGFGHFKRGTDPTALYAAVQGPPELSLMKEKVNRVLTVAGAPHDTRKYTPHVTLAYLRHADLDKIVDFIEGHSPFETETFDVLALNLYQSHLTKNGSVYEILRSYPMNDV